MTIRLPNQSQLRGRGEDALTLIEVSISLALTVMLMIAAFNSLMVIDRNTRRVSEYNSALAIAEATLEQTKTNVYNPPASPFTASAVNTTNTAKVGLDATGTNFVITGSVVRRIEPITGGHLVTVVATFTNFGISYRAQVQAVVNKYTGGQP